MPRITHRPEDDDFDEPYDPDADGPDGIDDDPTYEDLERFGSEEVECPSCGASVWDGVDRCPRCGEFMEDGARRRRRGGGPSGSGAGLQAWWRERWTAVLVVLLILGLLGVVPLLVWRGTFTHR